MGARALPPLYQTETGKKSGREYFGSFCAPTDIAVSFSAQPTNAKAVTKPANINFWIMNLPFYFHKPRESEDSSVYEKGLENDFGIV
ncbi:hypothetical protein ACFL4U_02990 [Candidatus Neomarinimicrobiota bacterium]